MPPDSTDFRADAARKDPIAQLSLTTRELRVRIAFLPAELRDKAHVTRMGIPTLGISEAVTHLGR